MIREGLVCKRELKCKQFKRMFGNKCSLVLLGFNCWNEKDGRVWGI